MESKISSCDNLERDFITCQSVSAQEIYLYVKLDRDSDYQNSISETASILLFHFFDFRQREEMRCVIVGRAVRIRSCHGHQDWSGPQQVQSCSMKPCPETTTTDEPISRRPSRPALAFLCFPLLFTFVCLPVCIFYYMYEWDFRLHACIVLLSSSLRRRVNTSE